MNATLQVGGLGTPAQEQALRATLDALSGIRNVRVDGSLVWIAYEPVRVTETTIDERLTHAGFHVRDVVAASASPVVDAIQETGAALGAPHSR